MIFQRIGKLQGTLSNSDGTVVDHLYDDGGRLEITTITAGGEGTDRWALSTISDLNPLGQVRSIADDRGVEVSRTWTSTGEMLTDAIAIDGRSFTSTAGYDLRGQLTSLAYPDSTTIDLGRETLGRMTSLKLRNGPTLWTGEYHGFRLGGGVSGILEMARSHTPEGLPKEVTAMTGESGRYRMKRDYDPTLRYTAEQKETTFANVSSLTHDQGKRIHQTVPGFRNLGSL